MSRRFVDLIIIYFLSFFTEIIIKQSARAKHVYYVAGVILIAKNRIDDD